MSRFVDGVIANAARTRTGMVAGEADAPARPTCAELHGLACRIAGGLIETGPRPWQAVAVQAGTPAVGACVARDSDRDP
jgi:fatty-acyl-CoA synthase